MIDPKRVLRAHGDLVNVLTVVDDRLVSAASSLFGEASGIALWNLAKPDAPRLERRFAGANGGAKELTWWPNGEGFTVGYAYPQSIAVSYSLNGRAQDSYRGHKYEMHAIEYDPTGPRVLTASHDMTARLWTISGALIAELPHPGVVYDAKITASGDIVTGCGDGNVRIFSAKDLTTPRVLSGHKGNVYSVEIVGDRIYTSSEDKTVRAWEDGKVVATYGPLKDSVIKIAVHDDIVYASTWHGDTVVLRAEKDTFKEIGTRLGSQVVISKDGSRVATRKYLGGAVYIYDAAGKKLREMAAYSSSLAFSPDSRWLLVGTHDGAVALHSLAQTAQAPVRYLGNGDEWLVFDDNGDFDASPRGADRVAMVSGTTAYRVEQFALQSNRPDRLLARVDLVPRTLIEHYARAVQRRLQKAGVQSAAFELAVPSAALELGERKGDEQTVSVRCSDGRADLKYETLFVNGVPVATTSISGRAHTASRAVTLSAGDNTIEVSCKNRRGVESFRAGRSVAFDGAKGRLFIATLGVSRYKDKALDLGFAHQDATDVGAALAKRFGETKRFTRTDAQVNAAALKDLQTFFADARVGDTAVLFFAGHGLHDDAGTFFALPHEADTARLAETALPFSALENVLAEAKARNRLLLLDACESGESDELKIAVGRGLSKSLVARGLKRVEEPASAAASVPVVVIDRDRYVYADLERRSGTVVIASSRGDEWSFEDPALGHGLFTHGLLTALADQKSDLNKDGRVSVHELERAVRQIVREASAERQHPMVLRDNALSAVAF